MTEKVAVFLMTEKCFVKVKLLINNDNFVNN